MNVQYAFIIGVARSGTSILGELLASHPQVSYIFEAHRIWELGGMGQNESHRLTEAHATTDVKAKIRAWFKEQEKSRHILMEKCPRNTLRVPYLRAIFPEAKIIHVVRDGRDTACSMVPACGGNRWDHLKPPSWQTLFSQYRGAVRCALAWQESIQIALHDLAGTPHIQIRYEDLICTPDEEVGKLLSYLDLEDDPAVSDFFDKLQNTTIGSYHAKVQTIWYREDHRVRMGRYRENLTPSELTIINQMLGPTLEKLGYELEPGPGSGR